MCLVGLMMLLMQQGVEMSNWISVNDQLPEFQVPVFAGFYVQAVVTNISESDTVAA